MKRFFRYYYIRFIRLRGEPDAVARGLAIGVFIGITPTIPLHTILSLLLAMLFKGSKIGALLAATLVSNPLTIFPLYYLSWRIGNYLTTCNLSWERIKQTLDLLLADVSFMEKLTTISNLGQEAIIVMVLGGIILALPFSVISYFAGLHFFTALRKRRKLKKLKKAADHVKHQTKT
jgi:uncharacterized protein (DUF2062 family)